MLLISIASDLSAIKEKKFNMKSIETAIVNYMNRENYRTICGQVPYRV